MELLIVTGMSGAGKSLFTTFLEDMGYFCIDNLPPPLLAGLLNTLQNTASDPSCERYAFVMDVRSRQHFGQLVPILLQLKQEQGLKFRLVFLEASDSSILSRYKQSRRNHPLAISANLSEAIQAERASLASLRALATDIIDTTTYSAAQLREQVSFLFSEKPEEGRIQLFVQSFGFKYGLPSDADRVSDVRFIPNPFYLPELTQLSGQDQAVIDFVFAHSEALRFLEMEEAFLSYTLPFYQREGKVRFNLAIGCTGGRHRSVALANAIAQRSSALGYKTIVSHRDIRRDPQGGL